MVVENYILKELKEFFPNGEESPNGTNPFDFIVRNEDNKIICYFVFKSFYNENEEKHNLKEYATQLSNISTNEPIVVIRQTKDSQLEFGILCYWEYGHYIFNRDIKWRNLCEENVEWLRIQIRAKRMVIRFLPEKYFRVVKTINLMSSSLVDAEIVYLRKLEKETYKMNTKLPMDDLERFNRLLTGTPEEKYPNDELDRQILKSVQRYYPSARVKSRLLLFETELMNLRLYKDKISQKERITFENPNHENREITLECYYYPNFRYIRNKPKYGNVQTIPINNIGLCEMYEPLSALNI